MTLPRRTVAVVATFFSLAFACAESPPPQAAVSGPPAVAIAPIPYTARQIHDTCKPGHTLVFRIETPGKPAAILTMRFVSGTDDTAEFEESTSDDLGHILEAPARQTARWEELRQHGAFPRDDTTLSDATTTTPAGVYATTLYTVRTKDGGIRRLYFAKNQPGPPVLVVHETGGAPDSTMTLLSVADQPAAVAPVAR
jgi:hypothetical protein